MTVYRNLAKHWWWDGLEIKAQVDQDPVNPNQYNLNQTTESVEYDPFKYPLKPYRLGYLVITRVDEDLLKPVDVKLVCSWAVVLSFWTELELNLKKMFAIIEPKQIDVNVKEEENKPRKIKIPKRFADLNRWREVYKHIKGWTGMSSNAISKKLQTNKALSNLPSSPDTIAKIVQAGKEGLLD